MKSLRDIVNVAIALILLSFIGFSLIRIVYVLLQNQGLV